VPRENIFQQKSDNILKKIKGIQGIGKKRVENNNKLKAKARTHKG
jgi:hypothetical protein